MVRSPYFLNDLSYFRQGYHHSCVNPLVFLGFHMYHRHSQCLLIEAYVFEVEIRSLKYLLANLFLLLVFVVLLWHLLDLVHAKILEFVKIILDFIDINDLAFNLFILQLFP